MSALPAQRAPILVTGLAGNLGRRLARLLKDHRLIGVDLFPPQVDHPQVDFSRLDLSRPEATPALEQLLRISGARQVIHLAFVLDPARTGAVARQRQWEINVGGTAHLLQAIERVNRSQRQVECFLYLSSVTSYGPSLPGPVDENYPQQPHTYTYALHKKETEELCRVWHPKLGGCALYIIRGHIFLGPQVKNFIMSALRGRPSEHTQIGRLLRRLGVRLPLLLPRGRPYGGLYQFMHIDDAARLMAWLCRHHQPGKLVILNAQGRGAPVTASELARLVDVPLVRLPSYRLVGLIYRAAWALGVSSVPPDSFPYFAGSYVMDTRRLERLLGNEYSTIVRFSTADALKTILDA